MSIAEQLICKYRNAMHVAIALADLLQKQNNEANESIAALKQENENLTSLSFSRIQELEAENKKLKNSLHDANNAFSDLLEERRLQVAALKQENQSLTNRLRSVDTLDSSFRIAQLEEAVTENFNQANLSLLRTQELEQRLKDTIAQRDALAEENRKLLHDKSAAFNECGDLAILSALGAKANEARTNWMQKFLQVSRELEMEKRSTDKMRHAFLQARNISNDIQSIVEKANSVSTAFNATFLEGV